MYAPLDSAPRRAEVPAPILAALGATRPWVTYFGVLGYAAGGLGMLVAILALIGGRPFEGLLYLLIGGLMFLPARMLLRYRGAITALLAGGGMRALADAVEQQKSYWRFVGFVSVLSLGLWALALLLKLALFAAMALR